MTSKTTWILNSIAAATGAGTGAESITGTGAAVTVATDVYGVGASQPSGSGVVTSPKATTTGTGAVLAFGSGAALSTSPFATGSGSAGVSGSGAVTTTAAFGGSKFADMVVTVNSRPISIGPEKSSISEIMDATIHCEFEDSEDCVVTLRSDYDRLMVTNEYNDSKQTESSVAAANQKHFRHHVQMVPGEGFYGSFFQVKVEKTLPIDGNFKYTGVDLHYVPRPGFAAEFLMGGGTPESGW